MKSPNFRDRTNDPIARAVEEHLSNEKIKSERGYGKVIDWIEKKRPVRLLENLVRDGVISTWPPEHRDQHILIGVHALWCRKRYLKMQLTHFSKSERQRMLANPDFNRLQEWIFSYYENSRKKYVRISDVVAEIKKHFSSNNVLPGKTEMVKLPLKEQARLRKKQASIDAGLAKVVLKVRRRWNKQRESLRKENPGLGYGQRLKVLHEDRKLPSTESFTG